MTKRTKTGGRQKGTPNKALAVRVATIAASGETPLDYMLGIMRDPTADLQHRMDMAKASAPYVHQRLTATVAVAVEVEKPDLTDPHMKLQLAREILFMIAKAEHGVRNAPKVIEGKPQTT